MKRAAVLFFAILFLCTTIAPASAEEPYPKLSRFTYISTAYSSFSINESSGYASCYAKCRTHSSGIPIRIVGKLQRETTNGSWSPVTSWIRNGNNYVILDEGATVTSGYWYRFVVNFYILDSSGNIIESHTIYRYYNYGAS